jgi:GH24 family phage-related lysozyme (muramidase)
MPKKQPKKIKKTKTARAAAELSRLGASKGGKARARLLSPRRRAEIASKAAAARWGKKKVKKGKKK